MDFITLKLVQHKYFAKYFVLWFFFSHGHPNRFVSRFGMNFFSRDGTKEDENYELKIFSLHGFTKAFASWKPAQLCTQFLSASIYFGFSWHWGLEK